MAERAVGLCNHSFLHRTRHRGVQMFSNQRCMMWESLQTLLHTKHAGTCFHHTCTDTHARTQTLFGSRSERKRDCGWRPFAVASNFLPLYFEAVNLWTVRCCSCLPSGFFGGDGRQLLLFSAHFRAGEQRRGQKLRGGCRVTGVEK